MRNSLIHKIALLVATLTLVSNSTAYAQDLSHVNKINELLRIERLGSVSSRDCITDNYGTSCSITSQHIMDWNPIFQCFMLFDEYDNLMMVWDRNYNRSAYACD